MGRRDKWLNYRAAIQSELREHKSSFIVFSVMRFLVIAVLVHQAIVGAYENVYLCALTLLLLFLPSIVQVQFKIEIPPVLEIIIFCFIFAAEILGSLIAFYDLIPFWDTMLHTLNGFLAAAIGYSLVWLLNESEHHKIDLSPIYLVIVAFCFSMTIGVIWEFFEFGMDTLFAADMQRDTIVSVIDSRLLAGNTEQIAQIDNISEVLVNGEPLGLGGYLDIGLIDTMKDMFVNLIGALVFSVFGFFYAKKQSNDSIDNIIPKKKLKHQNYLKPENRG